MSAHNVANRAVEKGLSIIAVTDHNSMANCPVYQKIAESLGLIFFWGVEIQTIEEIHIIALFDNNDLAREFDSELYESLLPVTNNPDFFGDQVVIDENEDIIRFEDKALINSSTWSLQDLIEKLTLLDCFYFPAHIDAETYSIIGQLGFIPSDIEFPALGITAGCDLPEFLKIRPELTNYPFIRNSDAHYLKEIGSGYTDFFLEEATLKEIRFACQKIGSRKYVV